MEMRIEGQSKHNRRPALVKKRAVKYAIIAACLLLPLAAQASGSGMPWEGWIGQLANSIAGPYAKAVGALLILGCGIGIANGDGNVKKAFQVGTGLSIAFTATSFGLNFLGFSGGALFS